jgi:hypothetical protein
MCDVILYNYQDRAGYATNGSNTSTNGPRKNTRDATEGSKDYSLLVHSSLLQNEILGAGIEDFKEASEERRVLSPVPPTKNLFSVRIHRSLY